MRLVSCANEAEHWATKYRRNKKQKMEIWIRFVNEKPKIDFPCFIIMTRNGPRLLDDNNLISSFKYIQDEIANQLIPGLRPGFADSSTNLIWHYKQTKSKHYSIDIQIKGFTSMLDNKDTLK